MKIKPRVYFDVEVGGLPIGRIVFELYSDVCPRTVENFRALCTGEMGLGLTTNKPLFYKGIVFHRVVKNFMIQSGDFSVGNGTGGESIYGGTFKDENFSIMHDKPFLLSMANRGKDTNGSQFFITTQPAPHLDNIHVVFGEVVSGQEVVNHIENLPVDRMSRPLQDAKVVNCGELVLKSKHKDKKKKEKKKESASESSSESDSEKNKKKKAKKKKWTEVEDKAPETKKSKTEDAPHPLVSVTKIDPDEIPEVPANKFLYRGGSDNNANQKQFVRDRRQNYRTSPGGRIFKGRGVCRYRSASRSRSRSFTPPHWKREQKKIIKFPEFQKIVQKQQRADDALSDQEGKDEEGKASTQNNGKLNEKNSQREAEKENTPKKEKKSSHGSPKGHNNSVDNKHRPSKPSNWDEKPKSSRHNDGSDSKQKSSRHNDSNDKYKSSSSSHRSSRRSAERNDDKSRSRHRSKHRYHKSSPSRSRRRSPRRRSPYESSSSRSRRSPRRRSR
ncbi:peptidyl-prolyl cis-trans isomerase G [Copidosoma floridanum]|uniref:peptidyl-prolyl cis-trans isomerase G n=1 Tax=Copidosoma floridanum TaxID=29053 RepID=UPI0006C9AB53|nr:peptidyl-prolyl cis-trans isomerase G [Copidosoma floridanum]